MYDKIIFYDDSHQDSLVINWFVATYFMTQPMFKILNISTCIGDVKRLVAVRIFVTTKFL